jgi:hypothetical protein
MYLILGHPHDACCSSVHAALIERGQSARIVQNLLTHPTRFSWRLDNDRCVSQIAWENEPPITDDQIKGMLVRDVGWVDPAGWQPTDLAYIQAETQAALLGWLWSLRCPVLNRHRAATWYRPQLSFLSWQPLLRSCGLPALQALVTNVEDEAVAFRHRIAATGATGAVYRPLTSSARYLVANDRDWNGLAEMQRRAPVCLTPPHGQPQSVCIIGEKVVWDGAPPRDADTLEPLLRRFGAAAGLEFVEIVLAEVAGGLCVVGVEHHPQYERFCDEGQRAIVTGLVECLTINNLDAAASSLVGAHAS